MWTLTLESSQMLLNSATTSSLQPVVLVAVRARVSPMQVRNKTCLDRCLKTDYILYILDRDQKRIAYTFNKTGIYTYKNPNPSLPIAFYKTSLSAGIYK